MFENFSIPKEFIPSDPRFGSGPSLVSTEIVKKLEKTGSSYLGTSHRKPAVKNVVKGIQEGLANYFQLDSEHEVVLGNGGATFLFDMIGLGIVDKRSTHFTCGEFSSKWFKAHDQIPWIGAKNIESEYGQGCELEDDVDSDVICGTLNETSTGVQLNGLPKLSDNNLLAIDATSGGGQCPCDVNATDLYFFSPQKVFASEGGLFVAIMSKKAIDRALKINGDSSRYIPDIMNWKIAIDNSAKNQTYNTPALSTLFFLNEQIKAMNELGHEKVQSMAREKADLLYDWATEKPYLSCYIQDERIRSVSVATIDVDEKVPVGDIIKRLESEHVVYGIDAYRKLGRNQFRISLFHNIKKDDVEKLTKLLSMMIESIL